MNRTSKNRWLTYSIYALLIGITLFCLWLGWQARIVSERTDVKTMVKSYGGDWKEDRSGAMRVSWARDMLGDKPIAKFVDLNKLPEQEYARAREAFPESTFVSDAANSLNQ
jgi:hypothetical protein